MAFMAPVIIGTVLMYTLPRTPENKGPLLLGYYFLAFVFSANPLIVAWMTGNCAGKSKKASLYCAFNAAVSLVRLLLPFLRLTSSLLQSAVGNIIAPQLFKAADAPL